jgi:DNA-binding Lrp family transcriptional regulator
LAVIQLANGKVTVASLAKALNLSIPQTYAVVRGLIEKKVIIRNKGLLVFEKRVSVSLLVRVLLEHNNLANNLFGKRLCFLSEIAENPLTVEVLSLKCASTPELVYKFIQDARKIALVKKTPFGYLINEENWPQVKELVVELVKEESLFDDRLPVGAKIYLKNKKGALFSLRGSFKDATLTAFSIFGKYGIKLLSNYNYYFFPKAKLSIQDVFDQAALIAEKENDYRLKLYVCLFYLKNRKSLSDSGEAVKKIIDAFIGKKVEGYPSRSDILEKAKLYDIRV